MRGLEPGAQPRTFEKIRKLFGSSNFCADNSEDEVFFRLASGFRRVLTCRSRTSWPWPRLKTYEWPPQTRHALLAKKIFKSRLTLGIKVNSAKTFFHLLWRTLIEFESKLFNVVYAILEIALGNSLITNIWVNFTYDSWISVLFHSNFRSGPMWLNQEVYLRLSKADES